MSSKSGEGSTSTSGSSSPPPYWSISGRMTATFAIAAFLLLSLSSAVVYYGLVSSLQRQSNRFMQDQINVTKTLLATAASEIELQEDFEVEYSAREFSKSYARITDKEGHVLLQTYRMGETVPVTTFPSPADPRYGWRSLRWESPDGKVYLLRSAWVTVGAAAQEKILQVALDISNIDRSLQDYRVILAVVIIMGTLLSALLVAFIVRRSMYPILEMTDRTRHITAYNLDERINLEHWPAELKTLGHTFDEMLDRLKEAFERLSNHVSILAHELRNPINVLMGEAEVALSKERTAQEYRSVIESSLEEYGRLSRMIESLLFIARFDIRESSIKREEINVCPEIVKITDFYSPLAEDKEIIVDCTGDIWLLADVALFRRAVGNLLSNALRYTPSGGTISVSARYAPDLSVEVNVTDTGCGIKKEDLPHIFDRFYRADTTRHLAPEGTGLGLAIVKSIMEHHGGSIAIDSEPGKGTSITLKFLLSEDYEHVTMP